MKKYLLFFLLFSIMLVTNGCHNEKKSNIQFKDDYGYNTPNTVTYRFTGESTHFGFETGKVLYGDKNERYILIKNFKVIDDIKNKSDIEMYYIDFKINGESLFSNDMILVGTEDFETKIINFSIEESGIKTNDGYGESDAFLSSEKEDFKETIQLKIKYCYFDGICETENFKFYFLEN